MLRRNDLTTRERESHWQPLALALMTATDSFCYQCQWHLYYNCSAIVECCTALSESILIIIIVIYNYYYCTTLLNIENRYTLELTDPLRLARTSPSTQAALSSRRPCTGCTAAALWLRPDGLSESLVPATADESLALALALALPVPVCTKTASLKKEVQVLTLTAMLWARLLF